MNALEEEQKKLEYYPESYMEPMKFLKDRGDAYRVSNKSMNKMNVDWMEREGCNRLILRRQKC